MAARRGEDAVGKVVCVVERLRQSPCAVEREFRATGGSVARLALSNLHHAGALDRRAVMLLGKLYDCIILPDSMSELASEISGLAGIPVIQVCEGKC